MGDTELPTVTFKKFLSHCYTTEGKTYLTKEEMTQFWTGTVTEWYEKNALNWGTYDVGLFVMLKEDTKARVIDIYSNYKHGQREALFPVGTQFEYIRFIIHDQTQLGDGQPKYEL